MSRLRTVGLYHNHDFKNYLQELRTPFEPLPLVELSTHAPVEVHEIFMKLNIENFMQIYDVQNTLPATQPEKSKLSPDNTSPSDIPQLEQKLMSLPELTPEKISNYKRKTHSAIT